MKSEPSNKTEIQKGNNFEEFIRNFKELTDKYVKSIEYNAFGIIKINFKDTTQCGGLVPWIKSGFINVDEYKKHYHIK